ncbi:MAG: UDP-N-acetylglucosamine 1-carboxyvinyltransferase [Epsilonproteobacteria bacterium]|nr:UDP-N-acetylglucosamine 1-carboxyvinyltransferase [Campylobacterota bacterium]
MSTGHILVQKSMNLQGEVALSGAKNAVLAIMASLLLTSGKSVLKNVPAISDVKQMIGILESLGVTILFDKEHNVLEIDTTSLDHNNIAQECVKKFRASFLVLGPLLTRFKDVKIALPGGDEIGARPLDYHIKNFIKMGAAIHHEDSFLYAHAKKLKAQKIVLDYPSVGATENLMMALVLIPGRSWIINAALEPEVLDLITVLQKMGASIEIVSPAMIKIDGVEKLHPITHTVMFDRLEAGSLLVAGAITQGDIYVPDAHVRDMDLFLMKLEEMGNKVICNKNGVGVRIKGAARQRAVSFKTAPYPGFATDLQPLMMIAQVVAHGTSTIVETVFENRFLHAPELNKMGADITASGHYAQVNGVKNLYGASVLATDIRAACALALAGLVAEGQTHIDGLLHWKRGYETLDQKLRDLGALLELCEGAPTVAKKVTPAIGAKKVERREL